MDRRNAIKSIAVAGAAAALPKFSAAEVGKKSQLKVGLVGCSGRGIGAVENMLQAANGSVKIVAIADLFADRNDLAIKAFERYAKKFGKDTIDVPPSRRFSGWDAYKQILGEDIDIIIHATPPVFRPLHIREFVKAGKHLFVEKPACVDPVQCREMLEIADEADKKGLTIIPGIQRRFHAGYQEAIKRMQDGQIGEVLGAQAYWLNSRFFIQDNGVLRLQNPDPEEIEYQIRNWFIFRWTSGDCYVEQHVHNLDVILWGLGKDPKEVCGIGGRRWDIEFPKYGDRFSHFGVDFDFGEGLHCASYSRRENKSADIVCERFIGSKGVLETNLDGNRMRILGQKPWTADGNYPQAMVEEHRVLIDCVLNNKPQNLLREMVKSTRLAIAGRESAYSGRSFKYEWIVSRSKQSWAPEEWKFGKKPIDPIPLPGQYQLV